MKIVASIQVRMGSTRLPGKVMHLIEGKPLLGHLIDRLGLASNLDDIVVATSTGPENDIIEEYCRERGTICFRGSEDDVVDRMLKALKMMQATVGVEVFGDCPLIDPHIVDSLIDEFLSDENDLDFLGNDLKTTYPPGMEVEVFKVSALEDIDRRLTDPAIREHGTLYIRQHPEMYSIRNIEAPPKYNRPELELELDTKEDLKVISSILTYFKDRNDYTLDEIIDLMDKQPHLLAINKDVPRRWKQYREDTDV